MAQPDAAPGTSPALRLRPGLRISRRDEDHLQVGYHADERSVLPDREPVRRLLRDLRAGLRPAALDGPLVDVLDVLHGRGLVEPAQLAGERARLLRAARIGVVAPDQERAAAVRMLAGAGLQVAGPRDQPTLVLLLVTGSEPRRERLDRWVQQDRAHLTVTAHSGRTRIGPLVVPGMTACVRCVDEHLTDRDPRHPLVLEQHHEVDPAAAVPPADLLLALAWVVRDLVAWVQGERPTTWSATVDLRVEGPRVESWSRHPRCGCAWGDALAG